MKTAKELCEEKELQGLKNIIDKVSHYNLRAEFGLYFVAYDVYTGGGIIHKEDKYEKLQVDKYRDALEKLGYKIETKTWTNRQNIEEKILDKVIPAEKYLGIFTTPEKTIYKTVQTYKDLNSFEYYVVSACCGEKNEN